MTKLLLTTILASSIFITTQGYAQAPSTTPLPMGIPEKETVKPSIKPAGANKARKHNVKSLHTAKPVIKDKAEIKARRQKRREKWENMSHEEKKSVIKKRMDRRSAHREKRKEKLAAMSPKERAAAKERLKEKRVLRKKRREEKLSKMTPAQRERLGAYRQEQREIRKEVRRDNGHRGSSAYGKRVQPKSIRRSTHPLRIKKK